MTSLYIYIQILKFLKPKNMTTTENPFDVETLDTTSTTLPTVTDTTKPVLAPSSSRTTVNRNGDYTVTQCNATTKGTFIVRMHRTVTLNSKLFGIKTKSETLYLSSPQAVELGTLVPVSELTEFKIVERPFTTGEIDEATGSFKIINLSWLVLK
jgi:hypothetical protein